MTSLLLGSASHAATIVVTSAGGSLNTADGQCSISEAIENADDDAATWPNCTAGSGADTIVVTTNITLINLLAAGTGTPTINSVITIEGGGNTLTRTGGIQFRLLRTGTGGDLTIRDLLMTNGRPASPAYGGAIQSINGSLVTLERCTISGCTAYQGGAIDANGSEIRVFDSVLENNVATDYGGGAIHISSGITDGLVTGSIIRGNSAGAEGGGINNSAIDDLISVHNTIFSGNWAGGDGGAIHNQEWMELVNVTVAANYANRGGGLALSNGTNADAFFTLNNTLIFGNRDNNSASVGNENLRNLSSNNNCPALCGSHSAIEQRTLAGTDNLSLSSSATMFVSPVAASSAPTDTGDYHLDPASLVIDQASDANAQAAGLTVDFEGDVRIYDDPSAANETHGVTDIGADEVVTCPSFPATVSTAGDLAQAIACANANATTDHITLDANIVVSSYLDFSAGQTGLPAITSDVEIDGAGYTLSRDPGAIDTFRLLYVSDGELTLQSLDLQGGSAQDTHGSLSNDDDGGSILVEFPGSLILRDVTISGGVAADEGGGLKSNGTTDVDRCIIRGNSSGNRGGGLFLNPSTSARVRNSIVSGNDAVNPGGGMVVVNSGTKDIVGTAIVGNWSAGSGGGGIRNTGSGALNVTNSLIHGNRAASGMWQVWGTANVTYSGVQGGLAGTGNITLQPGDPVFVDDVAATAGGANTPNVLGDYHLSGDPANPVVDQGDNTAVIGLDIDVEPRIVGPSVDMGADEIDGFSQAIGETGRVHLPDTWDQGQTIANVTFRHTYADPIVVAFIPTRSGTQSVEVRARNVTPTGCFLLMEEPDNGSHVTEVVTWMVMERGIHRLDGILVEAGSRTTSQVHNEGETPAGWIESLTAPFTSPPAILHTLNTHDNQDFMGSSVHSVSATDFQTEQEAAGSGNTPVAETIGWIAFETGSGRSNGQQFEIGIHSPGTFRGVDDVPAVLTFSTPFAHPPDVFVKQNTGAGADGSWCRGAGTWTESSIEYYFEEDAVGDPERSHSSAESAGYLAIDPDAVFFGDCFVEATGDGVTDYSGWGGRVLQTAVDAVGGGTTLRVAGRCGGTQSQNGTNQTARIDKSLTIQGGHDPSNWAAGPDPDTYPTLLDAWDAGRVVRVDGGNSILEYVTLARGDAVAGVGGWGGAVSVASGSLDVRHATLRDSTAVRGGGLAVSAGATLQMSDTTIEGNTTTDRGAGFYVHGGGDATIVTSAILDNSAGDGGGGGASFGGTVVLRDSTLSGNLANRNGGGFLAITDPANDVTFTGVTVTANTCDADGSGDGGGGGLAAFDGTFSISGSIVAGNADLTPTGNDDCSGGAPTSNGYNVFGQATGCGFAIGTDQSVADARLASRGDWGGESETHALLPGSPAIDAGGTCASTDQRGVSRPALGGCDAGAFESAGFQAAAVSGTPQSTDVGTAFGAPLVVGVTANSPSEPVGPGGAVTFTAPASGASLSVTPIVAATDAGGSASSGTLTANLTAGSYSVTAGGAGFTVTDTFGLTNLDASPGETSAALTISKDSVQPNLLDLGWGATCAASGVDYAVYEGTLGSFYDHGSVACSTGGSTSLDDLTPGGGSHYYLIVPLSASSEGTYGRDSTGTEIPQAGSPCLGAQLSGSCP